MKKSYKILLFILEIIAIYLVLFSKIKIPCIIRETFNIYCPACGLTRAFKSILSMDIVKAIEYNLFSPIVFIFLILGNIYLIKDIILGTRNIDDFINKLGVHYKLIIFLLLFNLVLNNIKY